LGAFPWGISKGKGCVRKIPPGEKGNIGSTIFQSRGTRGLIGALSLGSD